MAPAVQVRQQPVFYPLIQGRAPVYIPPEAVFPRPQYRVPHEAIYQQPRDEPAPLAGPREANYQQPRAVLAPLAGPPREAPAPPPPPPPPVQPPPPDGEYWRPPARGRQMDPPRVPYYLPDQVDIERLPPVIRDELPRANESYVWGNSMVAPELLDIVQQARPASDPVAPPVQAEPPSQGRRLIKFLRKHVPTQ